MSQGAQAEKQQPTSGGFPGGEVTPGPGELRIAMEKQPYAQIIGHAVLEPDVEVCGVLVGRVLEDARGPYLSITHIIRGEAARQQGAQVTFTHDTWNHIHREMDAKHPDAQIVGWYHTHGGFGIFLSEMDTFIHRNFFSQPHQVAYVYDPLAGTEGFFHGLSGELRQARRYWLGGRERKPLGAAVESSTGGGEGGDLAAAVSALGRAATALQASTHRRPPEGFPLWMLAVVAAGALALGYGYLGNVIAPGLSAEGRRRSQHMLLLEQDPATGVALGLEVVQLAPERDTVLRDRNGELYVGVPLRDVQGRAVPLLELLAGGRSAGSTVAAPSPPPEIPPDAKAAARGSPSRTHVLVLVGGVVLALVAVAATVLFARRRRRATKTAKG
ncbi:Mov34/MPN/PAD-1 family protein [Myxococcus guangdongensis]|uniref:Mov34/MPN/PAD-1 family protein n=1 Tax=Myxococcus guangdongensis TaxID=2906760 RepID=UPI00225DD4A2|nr:Mov34/MPN/PAD-1 family protein [Myxococcus guangdongensis]